MDEVEEAKKRGYVMFKTSQRASRLGPYSSWCQAARGPQVYVHITGKGARAEMDLIFVPREVREQVGEAVREAVRSLYQENADGDERFVQRASQYGLGPTYSSAKCKTVDQAERIARGYVEIYRSIVAPQRGALPLAKASLVRER